MGYNNKIDKFYNRIQVTGNALKDLRHSVSKGQKKAECALT